MPKRPDHLSTASLVRHLLSERPCYPYLTFQIIRMKLKEASKERRENDEKKKDYRIPTYLSIRNMFYCLRKLGLVSIHHRESTDGPRFPRTYYSLVTGMVEDPAWINPLTSYYHPRSELR